VCVIASILTLYGISYGWLCCIRLANVHLESFCAGMTILAFDSLFLAPMTVNGGATVTLAECIFIANSETVAISNDTSKYFDFEWASIAQPQDTIILLQNCSFPDSYYAVELTVDLTSENQTAGEVLVISDPYDDDLIVQHEVIYEDYENGNISNHSTGNASTAPADRRGISSTSAWFQRVQKVRLRFAYHLLHS
jgi:hypothetical protein